LSCPDLPDPSSSKEHTSDNQCLGSSDDTTSVAKHSTLKKNWIEVLTLRWPVFWVEKLQYVTVHVGNCVTCNGSLAAITPFDTITLAKDI